MPGEISRTNPGTPDHAPYVPSHLYRHGPKQCPCGHHEGFHNDKGECLHTRDCRCGGLPVTCLTPLEEM